MKKKEPLVSICCITYNHELYIRDAIEGFLMQKTDFPFEILIHDDASTDGTADIIREYEAKYPDIIKPIYQTENQYSKGIKISATYNYPRAKGKYIALCEGDDYWIDPYKLQKQVDFLEANNDVNIIYHKVNILNPDNKIISYGSKNNFYFSFYDSLISKQGVTLSCMFRKVGLSILSNKLTILKLNVGDWPLECFLTLNSKGYYLAETMGVYRVHSGGLTKKLVYSKYIIDRYKFLLYLLNDDILNTDQYIFIKNLFRRVLLLLLLTPDITIRKSHLLNCFIENMFKTKKIKIKYNDLLSVFPAIRRFFKYYLIKI